MLEYFYSYQWLPIAFMILLGVAIFVYAILDGYDLGVGILMSRANATERDVMISSIGPFWDANETWLVLSLGILLVAFPTACNLVLSSLYMPVTIMLCGLILRAVSFDFRAKAKDRHKKAWNYAFIFGSLTASFAQGFMLGSYILGFDHSSRALIVPIISGVTLSCAYCLIGSSWLIWRTEGVLQKKAVGWAKNSLYIMIFFVIILSIIIPFASERIFVQWFDNPNMPYLAIVPMLGAIISVLMTVVLKKLPLHNDKFAWLPFLLTIIIFVICFQGIVYSFYPYVVPGKMLIVDVASSTSSLLIIFVGAIITVPMILGYTFFTYWVFRGKTKDLSY